MSVLGLILNIEELTDLEEHVLDNDWSFFVFLHTFIVWGVTVQVAFYLKKKSCRESVE